MSASSEKPLTAAASILSSIAPSDAPATKPKLGWKGAVKGLARTGALGASKRWTAVIEDIKATTAQLDSYDTALRKHTYAATIGNAKREEAKPAPCPVHSYNTSLSTLRPNMATFGKAPLEKPPSSAGPAVHSYSALGSSFTPKLGATFGRAKTGRGEPPKTACSVHSYSAVPPPTPLARKSPVRAGTFGTAPARPATIAMTRTGLLLSTGKPATLPPLTPLQTKARTATHALGFASKLKKAVSSADEILEAATGAGDADPSRSAPANILVVEPTPCSPSALGADGADSAVRAAAAKLGQEYERKLGKLDAATSSAQPAAHLSGDATPTELELDVEAGGARAGGAAALALELLHAKETVSPVKRKLSLQLEAAASEGVAH